MNRDSEFYLWTGLEILEGKKPYIDFYDHKDPLVFYLNALGMAMGGRYGMGLLLAISHFVTSFFLLLLIYKKTKKISRVFFASALLLLLYGTNGSGNQNGDIAALRVALGLAVYYPAFYHASNLIYYSASSNEKIRNEIEEVIPKEDLKEKDRVYYLNTSAAALLTYDRQNSCPYQTMQSWHSRFKPEVEESVTSYLSSVRPEYVVKENDKDEGDYTFLTYSYDHYVEEDPSPEHDSPIVTVYRYVG